MSHDSEKQQKKIKIIICVIVLMLLVSIFYKIFQDRMKLINDAVVVSVKNDEFQKEEPIIKCPEVKNKDRNNRLPFLLSRIKMNFVSGNLDSKLINDANILLKTQNIEQLTEKSLFDIIDEFEKAKTDFLKQEDISLCSNKLTRKIYRLITSQFYVEKLNINERSSVIEIEIDNIYRDLKKFNFLSALERAKKLNSKSKLFDNWLDEYEKFYKQIELIDLLESKLND